MKGVMVISIDFELLWGVEGLKTCEEYKENIIGGRTAIPRILDKFEKYGIHATWATVGIMLNKSKEQVINNIPDIIPCYVDKKSSAYDHIDELGENERADQYHYAGSILNVIKKFKNQEIATHTYSHYYCWEAGADIESFKADIDAAIEIMSSQYGVIPQSIVFPRNQFSEEQLLYLQRKGFLCYRGNPEIGYRKCKGLFNLIQKVIRTLDAFIPLLGYITYRHEYSNSIVNVRASRFFRPYFYGNIIERLKIIRIKGQMRFAAKHNRMFHLWWHPHNFGKHMEEMLAQLDELMKYFVELKKRYGMESMTMQEYARKIMNDNTK